MAKRLLDESKKHAFAWRQQMSFRPYFHSKGEMRPNRYELCELIDAAKNVLRKRLAIQGSVFSLLYRRF